MGLLPHPESDTRSSNTPQNWESGGCTPFSLRLRGAVGSPANVGGVGGGGRCPGGGTGSAGDGWGSGCGVVSAGRVLELELEEEGVPAAELEHAGRHPSTR
jgi:hypothetical protein